MVKSALGFALRPLSFTPNKLDSFMKGNPPISRQRLYQLDHKLRGLCVKCSKRVLPGFVHCERHHKRYSLKRGIKRSVNTKYNRLKGNA